VGRKSRLDLGEYLFVSTGSVRYMSIRLKTFSGVVAAFAIALVAPLAVVAPAEAATSNPYGVGSQSLARPASGGEYIYVANNGTDQYKMGPDWYRQRVSEFCLEKSPRPYDDLCKAPDAGHPLHTIKAAVRLAGPGDVIVVRGGTYSEAVGYGAHKGTSSKRITLQAAVGETVTIKGTLILHSPDYWTVRGIQFQYYHPIQKSGQSVVLIAGGTNWRFENNKISGSTGVANMIVRTATVSSKASTAQKKAAAPRNFNIYGNCIIDNRGDDKRGTDHNLYIMSSIYSVNGTIERNFMAGAPRGANIKASASSASKGNDSPRNLKIQYNTLLQGASGVTIGLKARQVNLSKNIIALPLQQQKYDAALKTYSLAAPTANSMKDSYINGYTRVIVEKYKTTKHVYLTRNVKSTFSYTGSISTCSVKPATAGVSAKYGQFAN